MFMLYNENKTQKNKDGKPLGLKLYFYMSHDLATRNTYHSPNLILTTRERTWSSFLQVTGCRTCYTINRCGSPVSSRPTAGETSSPLHNRPSTVLYNMRVSVQENRSIMDTALFCLYILHSAQVRWIYAYFSRMLMDLPNWYEATIAKTVESTSQYHIGLQWNLSWELFSCST